MLRGHLDLLLLSILADESLHGYAVIERLRERSRGGFDLPEGTVYPALHRLEAEGLLRSRWKRVDGRRRRVYALTGRGREARAAEKREWQAFSIAVAAVLDARA